MGREALSYGAVRICFRLPDGDAACDMASSSSWRDKVFLTMTGKATAESKTGGAKCSSEQCCSKLVNARAASCAGLLEAAEEAWRWPPRPLPPRSPRPRALAFAASNFFEDSAAFAALLRRGLRALGAILHLRLAKRLQQHPQGGSLSNIEPEWIQTWR